MHSEERSYLQGVKVLFQVGATLLSLPDRGKEFAPPVNELLLLSKDKEGAGLGDHLPIKAFGMPFF